MAQELQVYLARKRVSKCCYFAQRRYCHTGAAQGKAVAIVRIARDLASSSREVICILLE